MKRILTLAIVVFLAIYGYSKYQEYQRFHPPSSYDYAISDQIDINYHNEEVINAYYQNASEVGTFARSVWSSENIDVLHPRRDHALEMKYSKEYQDLIIRTKKLEDRLKHAAKLKQQGFSNQDIRAMELEGLNPQLYLFQKALGDNIAELKIQDNGQMVYLLQTYLVKLGYDIPEDGIFRRITEQAVRDFQESQGLLPTGVADPVTFRKLYHAQKLQE